jgi:hypothetical protein
MYNCARCYAFLTLGQIRICYDCNGIVCSDCSQNVFDDDSQIRVRVCTKCIEGGGK